MSNYGEFLFWVADGGFVVPSIRQKLSRKFTLGYKALKEVYPRLFQISTQKDLVISAIKEEDGNDPNFNNTLRSAREVGDQIKTKVAMWMKAKFDIKVYSVEDFKCFLHGIRKLKLEFWV
ncbi:hypothetical protein RHMOL_Rhmol07G0279500 [Rhododendron molle]|uniref:Uncharacterized protein n=1 Tax=Rhododendron molle TaxID=49168 RepID=A0ACC0N7M1_RHOML|nr:hypothetical protein RHMOL_Rhmol07G0279500 [Rhododendron molle]